MNPFFHTSLIRTLAITVLALALFASSTLTAQTTTKRADVIMGAPFKAPSKSWLNGIAGHDNTGIYCLRMGFGKIPWYLEHYDNGMNQTKIVPLMLREGKKKKSLEGIWDVNGKLLLLTSLLDTKLKKNVLFIQTIDRKTLLPNNDIKELGEIDYEGHSKRNSGGFSLRVSKDESKILLYWQLPYDRKSPERFGMKVLDTDLKELWSQNVSLPYPDHLFTVEAWMVSNSGSAYVVGFNFKELRKSKRDGEPNYTYKILRYDEGGYANEYTIDLEDRFITDLRMALTDEENLVCAGFYSKTGTFSIAGTFFMTIDGKTKTVISRSTKDFGNDFMLSNLTEKQVEKAEKQEAKGKDIEMYEFDLDHLVLREDGGAVLVGEQYFMRVTTSSRTVNGTTSTTTTRHYYYNDIIVVNMNPEGQIEWAEKIPKHQYTRDDLGAYSSYAFAVVSDRLYFVFNDNAKNLYDVAPGKTYNMTLGKESIVTLVEMNNEGRFSREALFTKADVGVYTRPKLCDQISDTELVIFGTRGKEQRFIKATFDER